MHDGHVEDRIRAVLRAEGDLLPLTIAPDELQRRLALRRRERAGRRAGVIAAAVVVVAVGALVATTGGWFGSQSVGSGLSPTPSTSHAPSQAPLPCDTIDVTTTAAPPALVLGLFPGDSIAHQGALTELMFGNRHAQPLNVWSRLEPFMVEPFVRLEALASAPDACIKQLEVTYAQAEPGQVVPPSFPSRPTLIIPTGEPARTVEFGPPAGPGDWFIRVKAVFAADPPAEVWTETVFRIVVPDPAPFDDSVLGPFPHLATPPATIFLDEMSRTREVAEPTGAVEETIAGQVPSRSMYIIYVACLGPSAIRWSIGLENQHDFLVADDQSCDGTLREVGIERGTPTSPLPVVVSADSATVWRIRVATIDAEPTFIAPVLRMIETGNTEGSTAAAEAFGRCVSLADASVPCSGEWFDLDGARAVLLTPQSRVTLGLEDGWEIDEARITAVSTESLSENVFAPEYSVAFVDTGGPLITVQVPLEPGSWVVRVALNGSRDGESFGAHYDLRLAIE